MIKFISTLIFIVHGLTDRHVTIEHLVINVIFPHSVSLCREGSIVADFNIYADSSTTATGPTLNDQLQAYLQDKGCSESGPDCNVGDLMDVDITASNAGGLPFIL